MRRTPMAGKLIWDGKDEREARQLMGDATFEVQRIAAAHQNYLRQIKPVVQLKLRAEMAGFKGYILDGKYFEAQYTPEAKAFMDKCDQVITQIRSHFPF